MAILINDTAPRAQYTATSGQTVFTVSFEFFANSDLKVYRNATLLTLTTNYTVTGAGVTGGGSVTFVTGATAGDIVTIIRDVPVARTSDFPTSGPFNIEALNTDLDRLTAMVQQQETLDGRSLRLDQFDTPNTLNVLPVKASRVGRVLQFNDTTGQPEAGPTTSEIANAQTYATNASTSATAAAASAATSSSAAASTAGSVAAAAASASAASTSASNASTSASNASTSATNAAASASTATTQATNSAASAALANDWATKTSSAVAGGEFSAKYHAQAAATSASNASTSASNAASSASSASSAQTAAESARDATLAAYDNFDDRYLGTKTSNPTLDNDGNTLVAGALYFNSVVGEMRLWTGSAWVAAYVSGSGFLSTSGGTITGDLIVSTSGSTNALRITQTGAGNALLVEDSANPDVSPFVIDASGFVIAGAQTAINASGGTPKLQSHVLGSQSLGAFAWADTTGATSVSISKSRGTSVGSYTVVQSGDDLGSLRFEGSDGTGFIRAAQINASVDGTPGTNDMPGRLVFSTTADGASTPTERLRIDSSGNVGIGSASMSGRLQVRQDQDGTTRSILQNRNGSGTPIVELDFITGAYDLSDNRYAYIQSGGSANQYLAFGTGQGAAPSERMRIDSSGNVEIIGSGGSATNRLRFTYNGGTGEATVGPNSTGGSTYLTFGTSNSGTYAERFRIASAGQLGIGGANYGTSGQALVSNGSGAAPSWQSPVADVYTGTSATNSSFPIGTTLLGSVGSYNLASTQTLSVSNTAGASVTVGSGAGFTTLTGTWRARGAGAGTQEVGTLWQRTA